MVFSAAAHVLPFIVQWLWHLLLSLVVVYLSDKKTPYEYTDIKCDGLPSEMQEEIRNGKYMEDAKELYGFLENYSS